MEKHREVAERPCSKSLVAHFDKAQSQSDTPLTHLNRATSAMFPTQHLYHRGILNTGRRKCNQEFPVLDIDQSTTEEYVVEVRAIESGL